MRAFRQIGPHKMTGTPSLFVNEKGQHPAHWLMLALANPALFWNYWFCGVPCQSLPFFWNR